jgi:hypothetical protein
VRKYVNDVTKFSLRVSVILSHFLNHLADLTI